MELAGTRDGVPELIIFESYLWPGYSERAFMEGHPAPHGDGSLPKAEGEGEEGEG